ncbi:unnamed protein product [Gordionus sp. m RMFG-2023]
MLNKLLISLFLLVTQKRVINFALVAFVPTESQQIPNISDTKHTRTNYHQQTMQKIDFNSDSNPIEFKNVDYRFKMKKVNTISPIIPSTYITISNTLALGTLVDLKESHGLKRLLKTSSNTYIQYQGQNNGNKKTARILFDCSPIEHNFKKILKCPRKSIDNYGYSNDYDDSHRNSYVSSNEFDQNVPFWKRGDIVLYLGSQADKTNYRMPTNYPRTLNKVLNIMMLVDVRPHLTRRFNCLMEALRESIEVIDCSFEIGTRSKVSILPFGGNTYEWIVPIKSGISIDFINTRIEQYNHNQSMRTIHYKKQYHEDNLCGGSKLQIALMDIMSRFQFDIQNSNSFAFSKNYGLNTNLIPKTQEKNILVLFTDGKFQDSELEDITHIIESLKQNFNMHVESVVISDKYDYSNLERLVSEPKKDNLYFYDKCNSDQCRDIYNK